jgi:hypothetical protein
MVNKSIKNRSITSLLSIVQKSWMKLIKYQIICKPISLLISSTTSNDISSRRLKLVFCCFSFSLVLFAKSVFEYHMKLDFCLCPSASGLLHYNFMPNTSYILPSKGFKFNLLLFFVKQPLIRCDKSCKIS